MAYDPGAIDATLAAAIGNDPVLIAELRAVFVERARAGLTAIEEAPDNAARGAAARRLKGLAASFGAVRLMALATEAIVAGAADAAVAKRLRRAIERL